MLNNISDYLSLVSLILMTVYALRICVSAFITTERDERISNRIDLIRDYINNEEE